MLKEKPEDFYVTEVIDLKLDSKGNYVYFLLKKENIPLGKGVSVLLLDKIITLLTLFLLALLGFYLFLPKAQEFLFLNVY